MATPNFSNRTLYHGDNLPFLRGMNSESVHLIATDPPFNKGKDFHATPDSLAAGAKFQDRWRWADDVEQAWVDQIEDDWPAVHAVIEAAKISYGQDMAAFLCFMGVRLLEMRRILKPTGSLYLHCDPTASHYLKQLMDAVFGWRNFKNEVIWHYQTGGASRSRYSRKHDVLLFYSVGDTWTFNSQDVAIPRTEKAMQRAQNPKGARISIGNTHKNPDDVFAIQQMNPMAQERVGYPTQKPLALYERIIRASSNEGDVVLDPFCGCATTPVAAERLGRQWVGMDLWKGAYDLVVQRVNDSRQLLVDIPPGVSLETTPPARTDGGMAAAPFIQVTERYAEPDGPRMSRTEMYEYLLAQHGHRCQGCDRVFDDPRYLELDHNTPRSDGGLNHITNRVLLCGPCNRAKSNTYTLSGLRRLNRANGWMVG